MGYLHSQSSQLRKAVNQVDLVDLYVFLKYDVNDSIQYICL